ncbi:MAG: ABC transporter ATP-binding protein [Bacteriovoracales bacterium]|nr:ABC transporter ATP-binding protein [Bacteriovoracales bacterium]
MIDLRDISIRYGERSIFKGFSQTFSKGKIHILLGPSGCGKTSLLKAMSGLLKPEIGRIFLNGKDIDTIHGKEKIKYFALMFQNPCLLPHIRAKDNILFPGKIIRLAPKDLKDRLTRLCQMVRLEEHHLNKYPAQLSGGERQRVSLMRSLLLSPPIIFMDEPLSALDPLVRHALLVDLKKVFKKLGHTIVLVTHDLREASYLGDHIYLIQEGKIVQDGTFSDLYQNPKTEFTKRFITSQMPGTHD